MKRFASLCLDCDVHLTCLIQDNQIAELEDKLRVKELQYEESLRGALQTEKKRAIELVDASKASWEQEKQVS